MLPLREIIWLSIHGASGMTQKLASALQRVCLCCLHPSALLSGWLIKLLRVWSVRCAKGLTQLALLPLSFLEVISKRTQSRMTNAKMRRAAKRRQRRRHNKRLKVRAKLHKFVGVASAGQGSDSNVGQKAGCCRNKPSVAKESSLDSTVARGELAPRWGLNKFGVVEALCKVRLVANAAHAMPCNNPSSRRERAVLGAALEMVADDCKKEGKAAKKKCAKEARAERRREARHRSGIVVSSAIAE